MSRPRSVTFTINNYTEDEYNNVHDYIQDKKYAIVGKEVGEDKTPHLQGYINFGKKVAFQKISEALPRAHIECAKGSAIQNQKYCSKDNDFEEFGDIPQQGKRCDLVQCRKRKMEGANEATLIEEFGGTWLRYKSHICESIITERSDDIKKDMLSDYEGVKWKDWQENILRQIILEEPDSRKIHWYVDTVGGTGKTYLAKYLVVRDKAIRFENGKSADIKHAYNGEKVVIFDYSRSSEHKINYQVLEDIKNGIMFSPKYGSQMKIFDIPFVYVMANFPPDKSTLSQDRWDIHNIVSTSNGTSSPVPTKKRYNPCCSGVEPCNKYPWLLKRSTEHVQRSEEETELQQCTSL